MKCSVCVLGLGYIGLPTAAVLAARGARVHGVDVNPAVVETINDGRIHIVEPELDEFVRSAVDSGRLTAHLEPIAADVFIIAVPTPFTSEHKPDIRYVESATRALAPVLAAGNLVILESTSPVGTTERVAAILAELRPDLRVPRGPADAGDITVAHCPERVLPGQVIRELVENDRIVGGITAACTEAAVTFYRRFVSGKCLATTARTAEMCKLTENAFRDVNIAFANELSLICDRIDIDVWELIRMANHHPRVNILQPGCGVGGHCIAVDPWFIVDAAPAEAKLIRQAREVNDAKPHWIVERVVAAAEACGARRIGVFGLAFKPDIDDLRESPALEIALALARRGFELDVVEPNVASLPAVFAEFDNVRLVDLPTGRQAEVRALLVRHSSFVDAFRNEPASPGMIDGCGVTRRL